jgi:hypothetical protein
MAFPAAPGKRLSGRHAPRAARPWNWRAYVLRPVPIAAADRDAVAGG